MRASSLLLICSFVVTFLRREHRDPVDPPVKRRSHRSAAPHKHKYGTDEWLVRCARQTGAVKRRARARHTWTAETNLQHICSLFVSDLALRGRPTPARVLLVPIVQMKQCREKAVRAADECAALGICRPGPVYVAAAAALAALAFGAPTDAFRVVALLHLKLLLNFGRQHV